MPKNLLEGIDIQSFNQGQPIDLLGSVTQAQGEPQGLTGIAQDAARGLMSALKSIPGLLKGAPAELLGATEQVAEMPYETLQMLRGKQGLPRATQNIWGGLGQMGHDVLSAPAAFRDYLVKKGMISQDAPSMRLPESVLPREYDYAEALGRKGTQKGDILMQMLPGLLGAPEAAPGAKALAESLVNLGEKGLEGAKEIPQYFPLTRGIASKPLQQAKELAAARNIQGLNISPEILEQASKFMPKEDILQDLISNAAKGGYEDIFRLQSEMGGLSRDMQKFLSPATEKAIGRRGGEIREQLKDALKEELRAKGHEDIAKLLERGQERYRRHAKLKKYGKVGLGLGIAPSASRLINELLNLG